MNFLNPILVSVGLACVAIPIVIHILMRRRRRPVAWGALRFLVEAYRRQRRRMNLEQLLLLAARCLIVALLALALGKPVLGAAGLLSSGGPRTLFIVLDDSIASQARAGDGAALEESRQRALELIASLDASRGDRVGVITASSPAEAQVLPPTADVASAAAMVKGLVATDARADVAGALSILRDQLSRDAAASAGSSVFVALLGEHRSGSVDTDASPASLSTLAQGGVETPVTLVLTPPAENALSNIAVTGIEPQRSVVVVTGALDAGSLQTRVWLKRFGPAVRDPATSRVVLTAAPLSAGGAATPARAEANVRWQAGQETATATLVVDLSNESLRAPARTPLVLTARIDDDALAADNVIERVLSTRERIEVGVLAPAGVAPGGDIASFTAPEWLMLALAPDAEGPLRARTGGELRITPLDPARAGQSGALNGFDALLIPRPDQLDMGAWRAVKAALDAGAFVMVSPAPQAPPGSWASSMQEALGLPIAIAADARTPAAPLALSATRPATSSADLLALLTPELADLARPVSVMRLISVTGPPGALEPMLTLEDGSPLLMTVSLMGGGTGGEKAEAAGSSMPQPRGVLVLMASAPDLAWTNLPTKPLMVPLMQELVRQGVGTGSGPTQALAGTSPVIPPGATELARVARVGAGGEADAGLAVLPLDAGGKPRSAIRRAGIYAARSATGQTLGHIAFAPNTAGSATDVRARDELARWLAPTGAEIVWLDAPGASDGVSQAAGQGGGASQTTQALMNRGGTTPPISLPLLIAAGLIALLETLMARWFSHAKADSFTPSGSAA